MSQEGPKILQDSLLPEGGTRVKGALKIAAANLSLFFPPATILLAGIGYIVLIPQGLGMWCTGKVMSVLTKKHGDASRDLMAEGKDLMWTGAMLCVPYVGPALLMADGAVNVTTGKNYGADGYLATFENFKIAVNDTKEYLGQKIDGLKKKLGLGKEGNGQDFKKPQVIKSSQEEEKPKNMNKAVNEANKVNTSAIQPGGNNKKTYVPPDKTEKKLGL